MRRKPLPTIPDHAVRERLLDDVRAESRRGRNSLFLGILAVGTLLLVGSFSAYQATEEHRAAGLLQSGVASLTDVDALLAEQLPDLRVEAAESEANDLAVPGFPIDVTLTRDEVMTGSSEEVRSLLLRRAAAAVYVEGLEAFDSTGNQSLGITSAEGLLNRVIGQLTGSTHSRAGLLALIALIACTLAGTVVMLSERSYRSVRAIAIAIAAGAFPGLVLSAAAVYAMGRVGGADPFVTQVTGLLGNLFEVPRRNYLVVILAAIGLAVIAYAADRVAAFAGGASQIREDRQPAARQQVLAARDGDEVPLAPAPPDEALQDDPSDGAAAVAAEIVEEEVAG